MEVAPDAKRGVYASAGMRRLLAQIRQVARTELTVLILGETGTGKEVVAEEVHDMSGRAREPFVPFNVTAVPRDMLEGQLFGYRRGAFTGAVSDAKGLIRQAEGGTLFIDEIGELSLDLQPKLLRFLESGEIQPLGERPQKVNVRVVAATNARLEELVRDGPVPRGPVLSPQRGVADDSAAARPARGDPHARQPLPDRPREAGRQVHPATDAAGPRTPLGLRLARQRPPTHERVEAHRGAQRRERTGRRGPPLTSHQNDPPPRRRRPQPTARRCT